MTKLGKFLVSLILFLALLLAFYAGFVYGQRRAYRQVLGILLPMIEKVDLTGSI